VAVARRTVVPIIAAAARINEAGDENVRRDLASLPRLLDRVDELLKMQTIGGAEVNAADFQIATSTALLATMADIRPLIEGRPALEHARRVAPGYPGQLPRVFPAAWLPA
jgi:glutathione S-transferase